MIQGLLGYDGELRGGQLGRRGSRRHDASPCCHSSNLKVFHFRLVVLQRASDAGSAPYPAGCQPDQELLLLVAVYELEAVVPEVVVILFVRFRVEVPLAGVELVAD